MADMPFVIGVQCTQTYSLSSVYTGVHWRTLYTLEYINNRYVHKHDLCHRCTLAYIVHIGAREQ